MKQLWMNNVLGHLLRGRVVDIIEGIFFPGGRGTTTTTSTTSATSATYKANVLSYIYSYT